MNHADLCRYVEAALQVERNCVHAGQTPSHRWDWVPEVELVARIRSELLASGVTADRVRMNAQGRKRAGSTNHDLEIDFPLATAVEVVTATRQAVSTAIDNDLTWLQGGTDRHVVLFLPTLEEGYRTQSSKHPYDLAHAHVRHGPGRRVLSDALSPAGLVNRSLFSGIIATVVRPHGNTPRWSVAANPVAYQAFGNVSRSVIGRRSDCLWAIVWSAI